MHAPPSWKAEPVGGCPASITQTLPASVAVGSGTFWTPTHLLSAEMDMTCGQSSLRPSVLGTLGIWDQDQSVDFAPVLRGKEKKTRKTGDVSHVLMLPQSTKVERKLFKLAIGQSLQNEGRALFLPIFLYMH